MGWTQGRARPLDECGAQLENHANDWQGAYAYFCIYVRVCIARNMWSVGELRASSTKILYYTGSALFVKYARALERLVARASI